VRFAFLARSPFRVSPLQEARVSVTPEREGEASLIARRRLVVSRQECQPLFLRGDFHERAIRPATKLLWNTNRKPGDSSRFFFSKRHNNARSSSDDYRSRHSSFTPARYESPIPDRQINAYARARASRSMTSESLREQAITSDVMSVRMPAVTSADTYELEESSRKIFRAKSKIAVKHAR